MKCEIKGCNRIADGETLFRGNEVCSYHENKHWKCKGGYIWKKLKINIKEKELQTSLC